MTTLRELEKQCALIICELKGLSRRVEAISERQDREALDIWGMFGALFEGMQNNNIVLNSHGGVKIDEEKGRIRPGA